MTKKPSRVFVVDRREGKMVVLVDDDGNTTELVAARLPARSRLEGSVLRVPLGNRSVPVWSKAVRDRAEEKRRLAELSKRLEKLKRKDPGGDVSL
ncbi:MAG TPA: DUF3006 domain-containing protein [Gemmatimonadaceae bacterium]|nr:DUF3006 domain-containing protein [Gemmatimonadaceae bacterium]